MSDHRASLTLPCELRRPFAIVSLVATLLLHLGCGSGSSSNGGGGGPVSIASVSVSGPSFTQAGLCANFTATVSGTGSFDHTVQWYVNGTAGGDVSDGLISSSGNYCGPSNLPSTNPVTIKAVADGDNTKSGSATTTVVSVQISPSQAQLYVNGTQQFSATVAGISSAVSWQVSGIPGGNSIVGTVSANGLYKAPAQVTNQSIAVEAVVAAATSIYSGADITVSGLINIFPSNPQVAYGGTQQFTAQVVGGGNAQVSWRATYGFINSSGLYTASSTQSPDTVYAFTSLSSGSTTVQILGLKPVIGSISPQPATAGDQLTITGQNLNSLLTAQFPDAIGGTISVVSSSANGNSATVTVPQGSVTGQFYVTVSQGGLLPQNSNSVQFQRLARLRIRAPQNDVGAGESVIFKYALLGDSTPRTVTFSADQGVFSGSTYTAPASVPADSFVHVSACITGTQSCDSQILGLHPFRIAPNPLLVSLGSTLQLSDVGASSSPTWSLLAGGGSLQQSGLYTAGNTYQSGGPALVSASASGVTASTSVGVTGAFPGLLNRIYDYVDQHTQTLPGTYTLGLAVSGSRLYVLAGNYEPDIIGSYFFIDVYDITDPLRPVWLTAVESSSLGRLFALGQYLYSYANCDFGSPCLNTITIYSIQSGVPVLHAKATIPQWWNIANNQGVITLIPLSGPFNQVTKYDLTNGTIASTTLNLTFPSDANTFAPDTTFAVGNRLFVSIEKNDNSGAYILTYDISQLPPLLLGTVDARSLGFYTSGNLLFGALGGMEIYDISGQLPVQEGYIDGLNAQQLVGTQLLALTEQQGCQIVDVSNPQLPTVTSILFDGVIAGGCDDGTFVGNYVYASEGDGGIVVYDATKAGGPIPQATLYGGPHLTSASYDLLLQSNTLYAATSTFDGPALEVYDVSTTPANRLGEYILGNPAEGGFSVQETSNYVYFGMSQNIAVLDVTQPSSPTLVGTVVTPAVGSLAVANNTLYAGTSNNSLVVLDLTNPAQPTVVKTIALNDLPLKVRVFGNLLLVADNTAGLLIYDISNPQSPVLLSTAQSFALAADVAVQGTTAYVAADIDGLAILDISNPLQPVLISKTGLARIDPFFNDDPLNEALTVTLNNGLVYVGTLYDNGLVFGLDCSNLASPRIVSMVAYGDAIITWSGSLLFNGTELFVGGALNGGVYPVTQVDMSQPFDAINQYFPPLALQNPLTGYALSKSRRTPNASVAGRFHRAAESRAPSVPRAFSARPQR
jgi:hypothetical protein